MDVLDNLVKTRLLKIEPADGAEFAAMLRAAKTKLMDTQLADLSKDSRFTLAYGAAHGLALAALRWHGYRSTNRSIVFQCLPHTLNWPATKWRVLSECHRRRNIAEYEGELDIEDALLVSLIAITDELFTAVEKLGASIQSKKN